MFRGLSEILLCEDDPGVKGGGRTVSSRLAGTSACLCTAISREAVSTQTHLPASQQRLDAAIQSATLT